MAKVTYKGESQSVNWHGVAFEKGKSTEVDDVVAAEMKDNPFFEFGGAKPKKAAAKTAAAPTTEPEDDPDAVVAKHKGGGSYSIMRGDEELLGSLSKADAEAFNDMTVDEQDDYLASELAKKQS